MKTAVLSMLQTVIVNGKPEVELLGVKRLALTDIGLVEYHFRDWKLPEDKVQRMPSYHSKDGAEITHFHIGMGGLIAELIVPK